MGQALVDLAMTFNFDLPAKGTESVSTPPFEFPSLLSPTSTPSVGNLSVDMYSAFFMGVAGAGAPEAVLLGGAQTNTEDDHREQGSALSSLPATVFWGVTPTTNQERVLIRSPSPSSFSSDEDSTAPPMTLTLEGSLKAQGRPQLIWRICPPPFASLRAPHTEGAPCS